MTARYALYYAPPADDPLMRAASDWLGRDPYSGEARARPVVAGLEGLDLDALTEDPRHYGFHATLKAPFELAEEASETQLIAALEDYSRGRAPFFAQLSVQSLSAFLAFRLAEPSAEMQSLHEESVRVFDRFRAPLSEFDFQRRSRPGMSDTQLRQLKEFGYPGIFGDFRFHMTLTGALRDEAFKARVLDALRRHFQPFEGLHRVDGLALFHQPDRDAPFRVIVRAAFSG